MYLFPVCESKVLSAPLTNLGGVRYFCKVANQDATLWICFCFFNGLISHFYVFDNEKEFKRYYLTIKKKFKDEKQQDFGNSCQHYIGKELPF